MRFNTWLGIASIFLQLTTAGPDLAAMTVENLKCEYARDPLGVDVPTPQFSWTLKSPDRGAIQTGYQICVAATLDSLQADQGDIWDSGPVKSDQTLEVRFMGKPLASWQEAFWKIRAWDGAGEPSRWSTPAKFTMGLLNENEWPAKWIAAPVELNAETVLFRRQFEVKTNLKRAIVAVCGLGQYEMSVNGVKVGNDLLTPGWTKYDKTCLYDTYDITSMFKPGANAVGVLLGNGMYNVRASPGRYTKFSTPFRPQKLTSFIHLEYADGSTANIVTDEKWRAGAGPITFSSVFGGEDYDARLEQKGWTEANFDESKWDPVEIVNGPGGVLRGLSCHAPPIREIESLKPIAHHPINHASTVYDFGQNASVMLRMKIRGPAGSVVRVIPSELLHVDGTLDRSSVGGGLAYWQYTLAGSGDETYTAKFFYHGSRYFKVDRTSPYSRELPVIESLEAAVVHSSAEPIGEFSCSKDLFNRIAALIRWAQRSNLMSVLTDCPHRERLGWIEQDYLNGPSLRYGFDLAQLYRKCVNDMADSQTATGVIPDIAPEYTVFTNGFRDSPEWGSAFLQCAWQQYEWTGSVALLDRYYDSMKRYVEYLKGRSIDNIISYGLGDWYDIGRGPPGQAQLTPPSLTATATYYSDVIILGKAATLLSRNGDAKRYAALAQDIREAFNRSFFNAQTGLYSTGSQTANAMPVVLGLCDSANVPKIIDAIVADVRAKGLTSGDVGYRYLLRALATSGNSDVIYEMNNQSDRPGYGFMLNSGATTLTEAWDARSSSSQNHFMLGHLMEWFYSEVAGIRLDPNNPGYKKFIIRPTMVGDLTWVKCVFDSVHGKIASEWMLDGRNYTLRVTIPANTSSTLYLPVKDLNSVLEGGQPVKFARAVRFLRADEATAVYELGSGNYEFHTLIR